MWWIGFFVHLLIRWSRIIWLSLGKINSWLAYRKTNFFPRKFPLRFIGNCSDLQSAERELIGLEAFETAIIVNSSTRLCLLMKNTRSMGKELNLTPGAVPMGRLLKEEKQSGRGMLSGWIGHFSPISIMKDQWKVINTQRSGDKVDFIHAIPFQRTCWVVCITQREGTDEGGSPKRTSAFLGVGGGHCRGNQRCSAKEMCYYHTVGMTPSKQATPCSCLMDIPPVDASVGAMGLWAEHTDKTL